MNTETEHLLRFLGGYAEADGYRVRGYYVYQQGGHWYIGYWWHASLLEALEWIRDFGGPTY